MGEGCNLGENGLLMWGRSVEVGEDCWVFELGEGY